MSSKSAKVSVVVLNWNGWQDTIKCVEALLKSSYPRIYIIICDNGSDDDSVKQIRAWCASHDIALADQSSHRAEVLSDVMVTLIKTGGNLGFARGNNVGIRHALSTGGDYVFVLNNDTIVSPDCIKSLVEFGEKTTQAALMGPKVLDEGTMRYTQRPLAHQLSFPAIVFGLSALRRLVTGTRLSARYSCSDDAPTPVYVIPGSAMMFKAGALRAIDLFDEATFLYWEEFIIAEKMRQRGLLTYLVPHAVLWHKLNASITKIGARKFVEKVRSERYFISCYLKLSFWKRTVLLTIRLIVFSARAVTDRSYRSNFLAFMKVLFA